MKFARLCARCIEKGEFVPAKQYIFRRTDGNEILVDVCDACLVRCKEIMARHNGTYEEVPK